MQRHGSRFIWILPAMSLLWGIFLKAEVPPVIVPYFMQWGIYGRNYQVTNIPGHLVTHINYAFANPVYDELTDSGSVISYDTFADFDKMFPGDTEDQPLKGNINQLLKLKQQYPHIRTLISVGGWTLSDDFSDIAASSNARTTFAQSCVAWITNYGFDGIDLDWEYPVEGGEWDTGHRPQDAENYVLLLEAIRSQLDNLAAQNGACYLLTAATSCDADSVTNRFDLTNMCLHIDWFNVMTYDMAGPWDSKTGHNAGLYANPSAPHPLLNVDTSVRTYLSNGVPPEKIVLGLPFYGRGFDNTGTTDHGLFQPFSGAASESSWGEAGMFDFKDLHDGTCGHRYINHGGYTRYYDEISGVPYLYNPTSNVFISYDDEQSIALKAAYVRDQNLAGVMYWSADADTDNFLLQGAIYKTFYPFTISSTAQGPVQMAWQALTGQVYTVEHALDPPAGAWTVCSTLVDEAGSPLNIITGANVRVQAFDTNSITADFRCYRINMQTPAWP